MAACDFGMDWAEAPDSEEWLPLWSEQVQGWHCIRLLQRPYMFALCAAGPHALLSASADGIVVTDTQTWKKVAELQDETEDAMTALLPLPHADVVLSGNDEGMLCVWRRADWKCVRKMHAHDGGVHCLCTVGDRVLSAGADASIRVWQVPSPVNAEWLCESILWDTAPVTAVASTPSHAGEGGGFFSGTDSGGVSLWQLDGMHWEREQLGSCHEDAVEAILRHNSTVMLSIDCDRHASWWEHSDGVWCVSRTVSPWTGPFYAIALQDMLLAGDADGNMKIWQKAVAGQPPAQEPVIEMSEAESLDGGEWQSDSEAEEGAEEAADSDGDEVAMLED